MATGRESMIAGTGNWLITSSSTHRKQRNRRLGQAIKTSAPSPSVRLPALRVYLLKVPQPHQTAPPATDQVLKSMSFRDISHSKNHRWLLKDKIIYLGSIKLPVTNERSNKKLSNI